MLKRPELLKSSQQIAISEILQFRKHSEMIAYLIDKKINDLSYGGIREMEAYLRERLGIETFRNEEEKNLLNIFVELRNVYTHNNGIINRLFMSRVRNPQDFSFHLGKRYQVDFDHFETLTKIYFRVAKNIDKEVIKKFRLQKRTYEKWATIKNVSAQT